MSKRLRLVGADPEADEVAIRLEKIWQLVKQANDPYYPAGQAQAGMQLARVEVPWMLARLEIETHGREGLEPVTQPRRKASGL